MDYRDLLQKAQGASCLAYVPYSHFAVGAALLTKTGKIYTGCNVENAAYGLTICAEQTAVVKAISEGEREFAALAVYAATPEYCSPCGACRQIINEFGREIEIIMGNEKGEYIVKKAQELLPRGFSLKQ